MKPLERNILVALARNVPEGGLPVAELYSRGKAWEYRSALFNGTLLEMECAGLITHWLDVAEPLRVRRCYKLTKAGESALLAMAEDAAALTRKVAALKRRARREFGREETV